MVRLPFQSHAKVKSIVSQQRTTHLSAASEFPSLCLLLWSLPKLAAHLSTCNHTPQSPFKVLPDVFLFYKSYHYHPCVIPRTKLQRKLSFVCQHHHLKQQHHKHGRWRGSWNWLIYYDDAMFRSMHRLISRPLLFRDRPHVVNIYFNNSVKDKGHNPNITGRVQNAMLYL